MKSLFTLINSIIFLHWLLPLQPTMGVGDQVRSLIITTDSLGTSPRNISVTITWNNNQYTCSLTNATKDTHECNSNLLSATTITPNTDNPYSIKLEWQYHDTPLRINWINVTDNTGTYYVIDRFCIRLVIKCKYPTKKALF